MRAAPAVATVCATAAIIAFTNGPSGAQGPYDYPYCALDASSGATSCYYTSRAQCGSRCIPNPSYRGPAGVTPGADRYRGRH